MLICFQYHIAICPIFIQPTFCIQQTWLGTSIYPMLLILLFTVQFLTFNISLQNLTWGASNSGRNPICLSHITEEVVIQFHPNSVVSCILKNPDILPLQEWQAVPSQYIFCITCQQTEIHLIIYYVLLFIFCRLFKPPTLHVINNYFYIILN